MNISYDYGTPDEAYAFLDRITPEDKVALVTHTDHDGITSGFIMSKVVPQYETIRFVNYSDMTVAFAEELQAQGITKVITSDLFVKHLDFLHALEAFADILILDHHPTDLDITSEHTTFLKIENYYCAAFMCYNLFKDRVDLSQWDWFVASACIADYCFEKPAEWMGEVFAKYDDAFTTDFETLKKTKIARLQDIVNFSIIYFKPDYQHVFDQVGDAFGDLGDLEPYANEVAAEVAEKIADFTANKQQIPGGFYWEYSAKHSVTAMVANTVSAWEPDKKFILVHVDKHSDLAKVSCRRQDRQEDMGKLLDGIMKEIEGGDGGGHIPAAGGTLPKSRLNEFKRRLGV